ncbi:hypothetical protein [Flavobacterium cerinum]|uniref:Bacteriocin n=1 Tax=Flavobacterium cerinum TaxID=2502784 RepID=A0ABY5IT67_9FLAO|nr:hypothetical protein [Flavobacterium cerinum]UUC45352.1 hypothetical protein NOX80_17220 [Flavobacterium cerinum]
MKKLESLKKELFTREEMKTIKGGLIYADFTKTKCKGIVTNLPDGTREQDCGDDDNVD